MSEVRQDKDVYREPRDIAGFIDFPGLIQVYTLHRFLGGNSIGKYQHLEKVTRPRLSYEIERVINIEKNKSTVS